LVVTSECSLQGIIPSPDGSAIIFFDLTRLNDYEKRSNYVNRNGYLEEWHSRRGTEITRDYHFDWIMSNWAIGIELFQFLYDINIKDPPVPIFV
jgi:hypothetical protein